ncbi:NACHT, LRR and PYD domains-containing protein 3-like [Gastrophryne carolinensis]
MGAMETILDMLYQVREGAVETIFDMLYQVREGAMETILDMLSQVREGAVETIFDMLYQVLHVCHRNCSIGNTRSSPEDQGGRNRTTSDVIVASLEDLQGRDFKRFKDKLSDFSYEDKPRIPRGRLENADWVTTKNLLIDSYGEERAMEVTAEVLKAISLMGPAEELRDKIQQHNCIKRYMTSIKERYQSHRDGNARLGESVHLKKRYTKLLLIKKMRTIKEREHEIMALGQTHLEMMEERSSNQYSPITIDGLFDAGEDDIVPKVVVIQGPAGVGKTMTSQKIMLDWASGELYQDKFSLVFYLSCRELNTISGNISLAGLLRKMCRIRCDEDLLKLLLSDLNRKLFLIDGFDELSWWTSISDTEVCEDPFQKTSKEVLLNSLFGEKGFWEASVIITTRPYSLERLNNIFHGLRCIEILGFTGGERIQFFNNFFESKAQADLALGAVKHNDTLFTMCAVPIICWIVCTVQKQQMAEGQSDIGCRTITSIYLLYLKSLLKFHSKESNRSAAECLKKLCALANEATWNQKILFDEEDLRRHGLSLGEIESVFLNENIFQRDVETQTCYSFVHLSVQELLSAIYYVLPRKKKIVPLFSARNKEVEKLLEGVKSKSHLQLTVQFLFGLTSEKQLKEIGRIWGQENCEFRGRPFLEEWLMKNANYMMRLKYLYEAQDSDLTGRVMAGFPEIKVTNPSYLFDYGALAYCLKNSNVKRLFFINCKLSPRFRALLSAALPCCPCVRFSYCLFPVDDDLKLLAPHNYSLKGLFNAEPGIQDLALYECSLTPSCCDDLCAVFSNNCLVKLDLSRNYLQGSGIKTLCKAMKQKDCVIQELRFRDCGLTLFCCADLRSVMITNRLTVLDLSKNKIEEAGLKIMCEGLRNPGCTLRELYLESCDFLSSSCEELSNMIRSRSLKLLDLSFNNLQDSGISLICKGLQEPSCTLQELRLRNCGLTYSCCEILGSVISTSKFLETLVLRGNDLQDTGINLLCEGLRSPSCSLRDLSLHSCGLTYLCCVDLAFVITTNRSLLKLDLRSNKLQDLGIEFLCEGLRHPGCTLREINLQACHLTASCCPDLHSVITANHSLSKLELSYNNLEDSGIKLLCEGLRRAGGTLKELWVTDGNKKAGNLAEPQRKRLLKWYCAYQVKAK